MKSGRMLAALTGAILTLPLSTLVWADLPNPPSPGGSGTGPDRIPAQRVDSTAAGLGSAPTASPSASPRSPYRIATEDVLRVRVARHEEMGGEVIVLQDGRVVLPIVGALTVSGMTVEQVRERVTQGLRKRLVSPEVSVEVVRPRPQRIYVSGAVKMPQSLDLKEGWRVTEALANAGGLVVRPEVARGTLFRLPDQTIVLNLAQIYTEQDPTTNLRLQPGDVVDIQEQPTVRIYVTGEVMNPSMVDLYRGRGVVEALALAKGPTPGAALSKSYVLKSDGRKIPIDLSRLINQGPASGTGAGAGAHAVGGGGVEGPTKTTPSDPSTANPQPSTLTMEAGDQLVVPENMTKIAVFGMVTQPHSFPLRDGEVTTVADAISMAGGFDKRAQKTHLGIIRMVDGKQTVIPVDMIRLVKGKDPNPALQDRDIVFVPETRKPDWFGKVLPGLQALAGAWWYTIGR
jgi:protein involved in polysaccharide export with SLBB domain